MNPTPIGPCPKCDGTLKEANGQAAKLLECPCGWRGTAEVVSVLNKLKTLKMLSDTALLGRVELMGEILNEDNIEQNLAVNEACIQRLENQARVLEDNGLTEGRIAQQLLMMVRQLLAEPI